MYQMVLCLSIPYQDGQLDCDYSSTTSDTGYLSESRRTADTRQETNDKMRESGGRTPRSERAYIQSTTISGERISNQNRQSKRE
jgi:hypothetical protein